MLRFHERGIGRPQHAVRHVGLDAHVARVREVELGTAQDGPSAVLGVVEEAGRLVRGGGLGRGQVEPEERVLHRVVHDLVAAPRQVAERRPLLFDEPGRIDGERTPAADRLEDPGDLLPLVGRLVVVETKHQSRLLRFGDDFEEEAFAGADRTEEIELAPLHGTHARDGRGLVAPVEAVRRRRRHGPLAHEHHAVLQRLAEPEADAHGRRLRDARLRLAAHHAAHEIARLVARADGDDLVRGRRESAFAGEEAQSRELVRMRNGFGALGHQRAVRAVRVQAEIDPLVERRGVHALRHEPLAVDAHARDEVLVVALRVGRPKRLGECARARPHLPVEVEAVEGVFGPVVALAAQHVPVVRRGNARAGIEGIRQVERQTAADVDVRIVLETLVVVEIAVGVRRHHHVVVHLRRGDAAFGAAPAHHDRPGREAALEDFVPPERAPALLREVVHEVLRHPALEFGFGLEAVGLHPRLALRARLPAHARSFVAADVDRRGGKERADLIQHVFVEADRVVVAGAEDVVLHAPRAARHARQVLARAREFGIRRQRRAVMARQFDLGNDGDVAGLRVREHLADLVLRVEVRTVLDVVEFLLGLVAAVVARRFRAHGSVADELGVLLDFDAPALVLGEVPVEHVQLVLGHQVDDLENDVLAEEMAAVVDHHAAPAVARRVLDVHGGDARHVDIDVGQLLERFEGVERAVVVRAFDDDLAVLHREFVALGRQRRVLDEPAERRVDRARGHHARARQQLERLRFGHDGTAGERDGGRQNGTSENGLFHGEHTFRLARSFFVTARRRRRFRTRECAIRPRIPWRG